MTTKGKVGRPRVTTKPLKVVAKALRKARGNHARAAELLKCSRQAVSQRIQNHPELQELYEEIVEENLDLSEAVIFDARDGDDAQLSLRAAMFHLNNKGRERGYGTNVQINGALQHDHRHAHLHAHARLSELGIDLSGYSDEQLRAIRDVTAAIMNGQPGDLSEALESGRSGETEPER